MTSHDHENLCFKDILTCFRREASNVYRSNMALVHTLLWKMIILWKTDFFRSAKPKMWSKSTSLDIKSEVDKNQYFQFVKKAQIKYC